MSLAGQPPANWDPPYSPTPYLVSRSGLSRDEFVAQYNGQNPWAFHDIPSNVCLSAFRNCVRHVEAAPELVFERIVGNVRAQVQTPLLHPLASNTLWIVDRSVHRGHGRRACSIRRYARRLARRKNQFTSRTRPRHRREQTRREQTQYNRYPTPSR